MKLTVQEKDSIINTLNSQIQELTMWMINIEKKLNEKTKVNVRIKWLVVVKL